LRGFVPREEGGIAPSTQTVGSFLRTPGSGWQNYILGNIWHFSLSQQCTFSDSAYLVIICELLCAAKKNTIYSLSNLKNIFFSNYEGVQIILLKYFTRVLILKSKVYDIETWQTP
jgi:hypothetical protein